ncbi:MAG: pyridoxal phosphate-dependent aminotransferase [Candidatus Eisenbacteria bacterium]|nr:pyridoxal phosphate-dependent aminotransferase [Candidatus Eisenbacteria bacterium]
MEQQANASVPFDRETVARIVREAGIDLCTASIREMNRIVNEIEKELGVRFIRMEFGIPGLPPHPIAVEAEIEALRDKGLAQHYAPFDGVPALKEEASRFAKLFMNLDFPPVACVPTVGAMQGCFVSLAVAGNVDPAKRTILFLDPGFPVNKQQCRFLGLETDRIDLYDHRGETLVRALDERLARGDVAAVLWSSPNNPAWIILSEEELRGMAETMERHRAIAIEDLAYFGMDFRKDYGKPGKPPYQPTIARYMNRCFVIVSSSKAFSYAGQRVAVTYISPSLLREESPHLEARHGTRKIGYAFIHGGIYPMTACIAEGPQHGLAALFKAVNDGAVPFLEDVKEYARRAAAMKKAFLSNGFRLVYDNDLGEPLADGFYFTLSHPRFDEGWKLVAELLHYGVSAITLATAGSTRTEGLRACTSLTTLDRIPALEERLRKFQEDHP